MYLNNTVARVKFIIYNTNVTIKYTNTVQQREKYLNYKFVLILNAPNVLVTVKNNEIRFAFSAPDFL